MSGDDTGAVRRIVHHAFGEPQAVLRVEDSPPTRALERGEVRVRVTRSMIHPGDLQLVAGKYFGAGEAIPDGRIPGSEATGVIEELGAGLADEAELRMGTRVVFRTASAWQGSVIVDRKAVVVIPDDVSDDVATQVLVNTVTARYVLRKAMNALSARPAHILLTAASSAVGKLIAVEAQRDQLNVIRLVRSKASADRLAQLVPGGLVIATEAEDWQQVVIRETAHNLPLVLDGVGGPMISHAGKLLQEGGLVVSFGLLDGGPADLTMFVPKALRLHGVTIGTWQQDTDPEVQARDHAAAVQLAQTEPHLFAEYEAFDLDELPAAIDAVTKPEKKGNVVLRF